MRTYRKVVTSPDTVLQNTLPIDSCRCNTNASRVCWYPPKGFSHRLESTQSSPDRLTFAPTTNRALTVTWQARLTVRATRTLRSNACVVSL